MQMQAWNLKFVNLMGCLLVFTTTHIMAESKNFKNDKQNVQTIEYKNVPQQVSFDSVTELPFKPASEKIAYGTDELQYGLLWPSQIKTAKPLIVLVHGGCWLNAFGVDHSYPVATALSQAGFPVWSLEYRRTGDEGGGWPGSFEDIKLALNRVNLLQDFNINTEEIVLMGHSAGGHLALLAANELKDMKFNQVIGLAAITDVSRYALGDNSCQQATQQFMGGLPHEVSDAYHAANLIYHKLPATVRLLQGDADQIVPVIQSELYEVETQIVPDAGHFDWIHPGSPAFKQLLNILKDKSI